MTISAILDDCLTLGALFCEERRLSAELYRNDIPVATHRGMLFAYSVAREAHMVDFLDLAAASPLSHVDMFLNSKRTQGICFNLYNSINRRGGRRRSCVCVGPGRIPLGIRDPNAKVATAI